MTSKTSNSAGAATDAGRPVAFDEAEALGAFELARRWADRLSWPAPDRTASDELAELACMPALARWLTRWQPIHIHHAVLAGAAPDAVAAARWQHWRGVPALGLLGGPAAGDCHLR